jgi:ribosomal protein S18 acetylase RimI-like enzyme
METVFIAPVTDSEIASLDAALRHLSQDLGDQHAADPDRLAAAVCGPDSVCLAVLAIRDGEPVGALLASPIFSTVRGGAGLFVTDLWVAASAHRTGLARRLLAAALHEAAYRNAAHFVKLAVYDDNPGARAAYEKLGFIVQATETNMTLIGTALETLKASR